jgi:hypothetical protein
LKSPVVSQDAKPPKLSPVPLPPGSLVLPQGDKILHESDLFRVRIVDKRIQPGVTRDLYLLDVRLEDRDPMLVETATVMVEPGIWEDVDVGERVQLRCYKHPDGVWRDRPPVVGG